MEQRLPVLEYGPEPAAVSDDSDSTDQHAANSTCNQQANGGSQKRSTAIRKSLEKGPNRVSAGKPKQPDQDAMQELSKERRRRAFIGMLRLLEHGADDPEQLNKLIAPMSDEELLQVAEERSLAGKCGNPLCVKPFHWDEPRQKYRVSADNVHKLEGDCYCSKSCGSFIEQLAAQLVNPLDRIQPDALQQYLAQPSHRPKQAVAAQGGGVTTMKSLIQERDPFQLIHEAEEAGRRLATTAVQQQGSADAAAAVEGFIPRVQPRKHQQQQQHTTIAGSGDSEAQLAAEPLEVLQLNPVIKNDDLASSKRAATAANASGDNRELQPDGYIDAHKAHQVQQLQRINNHQQHAVDVNDLVVDAAPTHGAAAGAQRDTSIGSTEPTVAEAAAQQSPSAADSSLGDSSQPPRRRRTITFAPNVEYSCPAEPQQPPEQPVLTFTLHASNSHQQSSSSSSAGLMGELTVASADELEKQQATAALGGVAEQSTYDDSSSSSSRDGIGSDLGPAPELPEAWRLFFPPALGGVGVPVKQVVNTRPVPKTAGQRRQQQQQQPLDQTHQPRSSEAAEAVGAKAAVGNTQAPGVPASGVLAAGQIPGTTSDSAHAGVEQAPAAGDRNSAQQYELQQLQRQGRQHSSDAGTVLSKGQQLSEGGTAKDNRDTTATATAAAAAGRPRRFTPTVRPRRSVVVLDSVPGVAVKERGVLPGGKDRKASSAAAGQQQHQHHHSVPAGVASSLGTTPAYEVPTQVAGGQQRQQQLELAIIHGQQGSATNISESSSKEVSDGGGCVSVARDIVHSCSHQDSSAAAGNRHSLGATRTATGKRGRPATPDPLFRNSSSRQCVDDNSSSAASEDDGLSDDAGNVVDVAGSDESDADVLSEDSDEASGDMTQQMQGALQSMMPFLDTKGVTIHLSEFGLLWNAMHAWISPAAVAYVNSREVAAAAGTAATDAAVVAAGGKPAQTATADASASEAPSLDDENKEQQAVPSRFVLQQRTALANMLAPGLSAVVEQLTISAPQAELTRHLHALIRSFYMSGPLPALKMKQWQIVVALMLAALSAWRVPSMRHLFSRQQTADSKLGRMLNKLGSDVDRFIALLDLFELDV